jgi:hypothetical protein
MTAAMAVQQQQRAAARRRLGQLARSLAAAPASGSTGAAAPGHGRCVIPLAPGASPPGNRIETPDIPAPEYTHVPRLPAGSPESLDYLNEHGYVSVIFYGLSVELYHRVALLPPPRVTDYRARAGQVVIASVLDDAEVAQALSLGWDFIEAVARPPGSVSRNDPQTWIASHWPSDWAASGSNHSAAMWYVRGAPGVRRAWAALVSTDDLIVSYDQLSMYPFADSDGSTPSGSLATAQGAWYHTDQSPGFRPGPGAATQGSHGLHRDYAQGFVALQRTSEELDGNVVIPGSHREFESWGLDYFDPSPSGGKRGIRYDLLTPSALPKSCHGITAHLEAGDAFVWDSRTLHGACKGSRRTVAEGLARVAAYVCYSPRRLASAKVLQQRQRALAAGTGFGHQAHHLHDDTMMRIPAAAAAASVGDGQSGPQLRWGDLTEEQRALV